MAYMNVFGWLIIAWFVANVIVGSYKAGRPVKAREAFDKETSIAVVLGYIVLYGVLIYLVFLAVSWK